MPTHKAVDWTGVLTADPGKRLRLAGAETPSAVSADRGRGDVDVASSSIAAAKCRGSKGAGKSPCQTATFNVASAGLSPIITRIPA